MAKKDFSADALDAFELERPRVKAQPQKIMEMPPPSMAQEEPATTAIQAERPAGQASPVQSIQPAQPAQQIQSPQPVQVDPPAPKAATLPQEELIRRTYYISPSQHKALKVRAATSDKEEEKDISKIVRAAIDMYLSRS